MVWKQRRKLLTQSRWPPPPQPRSRPSFLLRSASPHPHPCAHPGTAAASVLGTVLSNSRGSSLAQMHHPCFQTWGEEVRSDALLIWCETHILGCPVLALTLAAFTNPHSWEWKRSEACSVPPFLIRVRRWWMEGENQCAQKRSISSPWSPRRTKTDFPGESQSSSPTEAQTFKHSS